MRKEKELRVIPIIIISNSGQPVELDRAKEMGVRDDDFLINGDQVTWSDWDKDDWEW